LAYERRSGRAGPFGIGVGRIRNPMWQPDANAPATPDPANGETGLRAARCGRRRTRVAMLKSRTTFATGLVIALALLVNVHNITGTSLWNDEAYSFFASNTDFATTISAAATDTQPPLYYLALTAWLGLGHGVLVLRSLSVLGMSVAAAFVYLSAQDLFGRRVAVVAVLLFIINPYVVMWAQKARPYALQTMLVAVSFWGFVGVARADRARMALIGSDAVAAIRARNWSIAATDLRWAAYILGGGLAMLTQHPAGFFVLGCNCALLAQTVDRRDGTRRLLINWLVAQILLVAIWMLWLPEFLAQAANHLTPARIEQGHQIFLVDLQGLTNILCNLLGVAHIWEIQPVLTAFTLLIAAWGLYAAVRRDEPNRCIFVVVLAPLAVCLAAYFLLHPVFGYVIYTFCWLLVPYSILLAFGLAAIRPATLRWLALGLIVLANLRGLQNYYAERPPPLNEIAEYIGEHAQQGDGIIFTQLGWGCIALAYYLQAEDHLFVALDVYRDNSNQIRTATQAFQNPRDWLIVPDSEPPGVDPAALDTRMVLRDERHFDRSRVLLFEQRH
jgi:4-amino-4-deoxy-L-arabinose transferase-like glycosyltransferase